MSKGTRVGGSRWPGADFVAAAIWLAVAVPILISASTGAPGVVVAAAQPPSADAAFTTDQAASGWSVYGVQCEECHGPALEGMEAPPLSGVDFLNSWAGQTTDELFAYLRDEMPPGQGGSLSDQSYVDLVAYLLESNGAVPGERTLTAGAGVTIGDAADISEARRAARAGERLRRRSSRFVNQEVPHELTPVTDAMLADPPLIWTRVCSHQYHQLVQAEHSVYPVKYRDTWYLCPLGNPDIAVFMPFGKSGYSQICYDP